MTEIRAVVFDMGGVLVRLGSLSDVLVGVDLDHAVLAQRWILSDAVRLFERGQCDIDTFAAGLIEDFSLDQTPEQVIEQVASFPKGLFDGAEALVADVRAAGHVTAVLSNTNALHWSTQPHHAHLHEMFDRRYLSHELAMVKPDPEIYEHVVADLGFAAGEIVFIDDNAINAEGAEAVGLVGVTAVGPDAARAALVELGVLA